MQTLYIALFETFQVKFNQLKIIFGELRNILVSVKFFWNYKEYCFISDDYNLQELFQKMENNIYYQKGKILQLSS